MLHRLMSERFGDGDTGQIGLDLDEVIFSEFDKGARVML